VDFVWVLLPTGFGSYIKQAAVSLTQRSFAGCCVCSLAAALPALSVKYANLYFAYLAVLLLFYGHMHGQLNTEKYSRSAPPREPLKPPKGRFWPQ
jgi:hypothetical protein